MRIKEPEVKKSQDLETRGALTSKLEFSPADPRPQEQSDLCPVECSLWKSGDPAQTPPPPSSLTSGKEPV